MTLEKTPESPLDYKEIKPVNPKRNQFLIFTGRTDAEAKAPIFGPPDEKRMSWLDSITNSMDTNLSKLQVTVEDRGAWHAAVHGVTKSWTELSV